MDQEVQRPGKVEAYRLMTSLALKLPRSRRQPAGRVGDGFYHAVGRDDGGVLATLQPGLPLISTHWRDLVLSAVAGILPNDRLVVPRKFERQANATVVYRGHADMDFASNQGPNGGAHKLVGGI